MRGVFLLLSAVFLLHQVASHGNPATRGTKRQNTLESLIEAVKESSNDGNRLSRLRPSGGGFLPNVMTFKWKFFDIRKFNPDILTPLLLMAAPFLYDMIPWVSHIRSSLSPHLFLMIYPFIVHHVPRLIKGLINKLPPLTPSSLTPPITKPANKGSFLPRLMRAIAKTFKNHPILILLLLYKLVYPILKKTF